MDINQLLEVLSDVVVDQEGISAWSVFEYGRDYHVFENLDWRNPPPAEDCPLVVFSPGLKIGGLQPGVKVHGVGVDLLVYDDRTIKGINGVIRYEGGRKVEKFRQLVFAQIRTAIPGNCKLESVETQYDAIEQFPYIFASMDLVITEEKLCGQDPYE